MHVVSHGSSSGKSQGSSAKRFPKTGPSSKATTTTNSNSGAGQMRNAFNIGSTSVTKSKGPRGATVYKIGNQKFTLDGRNGKTLDDVIEELVATSSNDRNWKGIFIAFLVISSVMGLILLSVFLLTPPPEVKIFGRPISFGEFLSGNLSGRTFNGTWISDSDMVYLDKFNSVVMLSISEGGKLTTSTLVPNSTRSELKAAAFGVSEDKRFVFLAHDFFKSFRYSSWAKYSIYDRQDPSKLLLVTDTPDGVVEQPLGPESLSTRNQSGRSSSSSRGSGSGQQQAFLQLFHWAPKGNAFAYVYQNNIYYKPSVKSQRVFPLTTDGVPHVIFNGAPDWVYEEEILASNKALWFSPDATKLAYLRCNDSAVSEVRLPYYESPESNNNYVRYGVIRYPKAGQANPLVTLRVVNLENLDDQRTYSLVPPSIIRKREHYIVLVEWVNNKMLSVVWMNRAQNLSVVTHCDEMTFWTCREVYRESIPEGQDGWSRLYDPPVYHPDEKQKEFLILAPVDSDPARRRHILKVKYGTSNMQTFVTHGPFEVTKIHGWGHDGQFIYFASPPTEDVSHRHVYRVKDLPEGSESHRATPECITCHMFHLENQTENEVSLRLRKHVIPKSRNRTKVLPTHVVPVGCLFNEAEFSHKLSYAVVNCKGPSVPKVLLFQMGHNITQIAELDTNAKLRQAVQNLSLPKIRMFTVPLSSGYNASVKLFLPPEITYFTFASYPLIIQVYAGPETQAAKAIWKQSWSSYLASTRNWIVAHIDGRGSGMQGDTRVFEMYKELGSVEIQDQIEVTKYLVDNLNFIDPRRIAVWGWSYGGYATMMAMSDPLQDLFQCGIAVAPVTNWHFYDSVYSERYMGHPKVNGNSRAYEESSVLERSLHFRPGENTMRKLFLIHGTRDDNVHLQHTMVLSKELVRLGIEFRQQIYPDATHFMQSVRPHLYLSMENFFDTCFLELAKDYDEMENLIGL